MECVIIQGKCIRENSRKKLFDKYVDDKTISSFYQCQQGKRRSNKKCLRTIIGYSMK